MLTDRYGRKINYLRLAVIDRCNLRCTYCMPGEGLTWLNKKELLNDEEIIRLAGILVELGIRKIRITGGEPFVRKDILHLLKELSGIPGLDELTLTTNGILTAPFIPKLKEIGIKSLNLSLDTLDEYRFHQITRRKGLNQVLETLQSLQEHQIKVKINAVVMDGINIDDIFPLVRLTEQKDIDVRFIEEMPFNGTNEPHHSLKWDYLQILNHIKTEFPSISKIADPLHATAYSYQIPGFVGKVGIIAAFTRSFCGSCNRLRITPTGDLRTCLYDNRGTNLKEAIRGNMPVTEIKKLIVEAVQQKAENGWEAERGSAGNKSFHESMANIGG